MKKQLEKTMQCEEEIMFHGLLIGLSGKPQAGKDTTAEYLVRRYGFRRLAFADRLREECRDLFHWNGVKDAAGRALLQRHGEARRREDPDYWIHPIERIVRSGGSQRFV